MPRPRKDRKVCRMPQVTEFRPAGNVLPGESVILSVDEYETLRLIDREGFSQEACGEYMHIARTTVQQIYTAARKKVADALVDGVPLKIEGGNFRLCDGAETDCSCGGCSKHRKPNKQI